MKKYFILSLMVILGTFVGCSKSDNEGSGGGTFSAGTYTIKATLEGSGQLHGAAIWINSGLGTEAIELSVLRGDDRLPGAQEHIASMIGKKEWEGSYTIKESIKASVNARYVEDDSVLTVYLLKDGVEVAKDVVRGKGTDPNGTLAHVGIRLQ